MTYSVKAIRAMGGYVDAIKRMDRICFPEYGPPPLDGAYWWFAFDSNEAPVGYASLTYFPTGTAFLSRAGVLPRARGHGLQRRLVYAREREARRAGVQRMVTYTSSDNIYSSNNMIRCGYRLYIPEYSWGLKRALYWEKDLSDMENEVLLADSVSSESSDS